MKSELDLFAVPYTQTSIEKSIYVEIPPLSAVSDTGPVEFFIAGNGEDYVDLNNTLLHLRCKITRADGRNIDQTNNVSIINYPIATIFSQVDVTLGDRLVTQASNTYPYRAILDCLLNYGDETLSNQFTSGLFYKDTSGNMDGNTVTQSNMGLNNRSLYTGASNTFELLGHIHADMFFQERMLINGVDLKIKMVRGKDDFCLISPDQEQYKLKLVSASLFVKKVTVSPAVKLGHAQALLTANVKYPIEQVNLKTFSLAAGSRVCNQENLFLGQLPKTVIIGLVGNDAFTGTYNKNPFNFRHYNAEFVALYVNGQQFPSKPFQPDFNNSNAVREYYSLVQASGRHLKDQPLLINRQEYTDGYTLYAFDLAPDEGCGQHLSLIKSGNMRLEMRFRVPLPRTVNLVVYAVFDNIIEVNQRRNVLYDYY